jgi:hypothetical protein
LNISLGLGEIEIGDLKCDQYRTINEMDVEKTPLKFQFCPFGELILKKESLTPSLIHAAVDCVEKVPFHPLKRNLSTELLSEIKKMMEEQKENQEISRLLKSLIVSICYRGSLHAACWFLNSVMHLFFYSGLFSYLEEETKRVMIGEKEGVKLEEKEKEMVILSYALNRKMEFEQDSSFLVKVCEYFLEEIEKHLKMGEEWKNGMMWILAVRRLFQEEGFYFSFLHFFI